MQSQTAESLVFICGNKYTVWYLGLQIRWAECMEECVWRVLLSGQRRMIWGCGWGAAQTKLMLPQI